HLVHDHDRGRCLSQARARVRAREDERAASEFLEQCGVTSTAALRFTHASAQRVRLLEDRAELPPRGPLRQVKGGGYEEARARSVADEEADVGRGADGPTELSALHCNDALNR